MAFFYVAANSIFLAHFPIRDLALIYIGSSVALLIIGRLYAAAEHRFSVKQFMVIVMGFVLISVVLLRCGFYFGEVAWTAILVMIWYRVIYLLCSLEFWGITALLFDVRQGKRLFSLISVGDVFPKILGYSSIAILIHYVAVNNLLTVAGACFLISLFILRIIIKHTPSSVIEQQDDQREKIGSTHFLSQFFHNELITVLSVTAFLVMIAITFIDFTFLSNTKHQHQTDIEFANFLGAFFTYVYSIIIVIKIFFSSRIINKLGVKKIMFILPVVLLIISLVICFSPMFSIENAQLVFLFSTMMVISEVFKRTLHEPVFLSLFQPLSKKLRLHGHTVVKGLVEPFALGLTGVILYLLNKTVGTNNLLIINYFILGSIICWLIVTRLLGAKYFDVLKRAVNKRFIGGQEISIKDKNTLKILKNKLQSPRPEEVIYSVELLQKLRVDDFNDIVISLLSHQDINVQLHALKKVENIRVRKALPELKLLIENGQSVSIKEAAIRIYCSFENDVPENILPLLSHGDIHIRKGAMIGLMKSGGVEAMLLAGQQLLGFINSDKTNDKILAIEVIGELKIKNFHQPIIRFMSDEEKVVREKAIEASGRLLNPLLIPYIIDFLKHPDFAEKAMNSLTLFSEDALDYFEQLLNTKEHFDIEQIIRICKVCGRINHHKSGIILITLLDNQNINIRNEALSNLVLLNYSASENNKVLINTYLEKGFDKIYFCLVAYEALGDEGYYEWFRNAMLLEVNQGVERIFNFLCLLYNSSTVLKAKEGYYLNSKEQKANAMELLENLISKKLQSSIFPILEDIPVSSKISQLSKSYHNTISQPDKIIQYVLKESDKRFNIWTQVTAIHSYSELNPEFEKEYIYPFRNHHYKILRDTSRQTLKNLNNITMNNHHESESILLEIEKVIVLKSTGLFAETPENILVEISSIIKEEQISKGEKIFSKGDIGSCLYVIYDGEVKIHDGDNVFATMKNRDFFGELALLDPEPRSATATAMTDTLLLRIDQSAFYELMSERGEVARGILKILCRRIRKENETISDLKSQLPSLS